jgi:hypothetical protein
MNLELQSAQASSLTKYYYQHTSQQRKFNHLHLELQSAQWSRLTNTYILTTRIQSPASRASISTRIKTYKLLLPTYSPTSQTPVCKIFEAQHQASFCFIKYIHWQGCLRDMRPVYSLKTRLHFSALHIGRRSRGASRKSTCNVSSK